jgi:exodeoxyribonuclease V alpha subunit
VKKKTLVAEFNQMDYHLKSDHLGDLILAYAMSMHKSQGSEYPCVVIPMTRQHYIMCERSLLYTAVTRGKAEVHLVGDKAALDLYIRNNNRNSRKTNLLAILN